MYENKSYLFVWDDRISFSINNRKPRKKKRTNKQIKCLIIKSKEFVENDKIIM